jgi:hypothetical protein
MGETCNTNREIRKYIQFWMGNLMGRNNMGNLRAGRKIL